MLPKPQRLNLKKDFKWVASGRKLETKYLKLFIKSGDNQFPRVGVATSGRIFKKATERSRVKRLVSQAFQSIIYHLPSTINIVALPKSSIIDVKSQDVLLDLKEALKNAKVID